MQVAALRWLRAGSSHWSPSGSPAGSRPPPVPVVRLKGSDGRTREFPLMKLERRLNRKRDGGRKSCTKAEQSRTPSRAAGRELARNLRGPRRKFVGVFRVVGVCLLFVALIRAVGRRGRALCELPPEWPGWRVEPFERGSRVRSGRALGKRWGTRIFVHDQKNLDLVKPGRVDQGVWTMTASETVWWAFWPRWEDSGPVLPRLEGVVGPAGGGKVLGRGGVVGEVPSAE